MTSRIKKKISDYHKTWF